MEPSLQDLQFMKAKVQSIRQKAGLPFLLCRQYTPDPAFQSVHEEILLQLINNPSQPLLEPHQCVLLGSMEGASGCEQISTILARCIGPEGVRFQQFVAERMKTVNYGCRDNKQSSIWEIKDLKVLDSLSGMYSVKQIKAHRRLCSQYKSFVRSCRTFLQLCDLPESSPQKTYSWFIKLQDEERKINQLKIKAANSTSKVLEVPQKVIVDMPQMGDAPQQIADVPQKMGDVPQSIEMPVRNENGVNQVNEQLIPSKPSQRKKKQDKQEESTDRSAKTQRKTEEKQKQNECETQREKQQDQKREKQVEKETKRNPKSTLDRFLVKKVLISQSEAPTLNKQPKQDRLQQFMESLKSQKAELGWLREEFRCSKMKNERQEQKCWATIIIWDSTIQYNRYLPPPAQINFCRPFQQITNKLYADDSSVEYLDLCGEECELQEENKEIDEEEDESDRQFVVDDEVYSDAQLQSDDDGRGVKVKIELNVGQEWVMQHSKGENRQKVERYSMICFEGLPMMVKQEQQEEAMNWRVKVELYKQIHGFYGAKEVLIRKLMGQYGNIRRSYLDNLLKEITLRQKNGQRIIKAEIISGLAEECEGIEDILREVKRNRDEEVLITQMGKKSEKDQHIEDIILSSGGLYIIDLRKYLAQHSLKMTKKEIINFIDSKSGPQWDRIKEAAYKIQKRKPQPCKSPTQPEKEGILPKEVQSS